MKYIITENEEHSALQAGNKAANLRRLKDAGFRVPSWFTITPHAFECHKNSQENFLRNEIEAALTNIKTEVGIDETDNKFAVRSSATEEDGKFFSFAGQLDSFLNVSQNQILENALLVSQSGNSERLAKYCLQNNVSSSMKPAVVVQRMVNAKFAGVMFSADPITGDRNKIVISAVRGLADRLVAGEVSGDLIVVDRTRKSIGFEKRDDINGVSEKTCLELAEIAEQIEELFDCPQDIEWVYDGNQIFIVQTRPITNLPEHTSDGNLRIWDNSNISESYQGVTTPLTFSFAAKAYQHVYINFCLLMGVSNKAIAKNQQIFPRMLGFIRGRIYYNLVNWYRLLALLPGFQINRPFMEQMMGVKEELPPEIIDAVLEENRSGAVATYLNLVKSIAAVLYRFANIDREISAFQQHFNATVDSVPKDLSRLNTDQLTTIYRGLEVRLLSKWDAPLINDFFAMVFFGLLGSLSQKWFPENQLQHHRLLVNSGGIVSAEPARLIAEMREIALTDEALFKALRESDLPCIEQHIAKNTNFKKLFHSYLAKFGDRCFNELKLESQTLNDNPLPLLRNIGSTASQTVKQTAGVSNIETQIANQNRIDLMHIENQIETLPFVKRMIFKFVANQAIERIRWRENLRFERTRLFGLVRKIFLEIGAQFEKIGVLQSKQDVFFLEVEEVLSFIEGKSTTNNLSNLALLRKREYDKLRDEKAPPNRIVTRDAVIPRAEVKPETLPQGIENLKGLGCSPGIVRGRVRVVRDPSVARPLQNEILIAERTDPGWIVLFTQAKGIIVEYGSLLSHTAIVSRELGIPAIVSASGVLDWLQDGDEIEFDGTTGRIEKLKDSKNAILDTLQSDSTMGVKSTEHDLDVNVVKLIESKGLRREAS